MVGFLSIFLVVALKLHELIRYALPNHLFSSISYVPPQVTSSSAIVLFAMTGRIPYFPIKN